MGLTALSKNWLTAVLALSVYIILDGLSCTVLTAFILLILLLYVGYHMSIPENEDMDYLTASIYHKKGVIMADDDIPVSFTQNCMVYFDSVHDFQEVQKMFAFSCFKFRRLSCVGRLESESDARWNTKWIPVQLNDEVMNRMIRKHIVHSTDEVHLKMDEICNQCLPTDLPQWSMDYIENVENKTCAWLWRVSHGVADGIRLIPVTFLYSLMFSSILYMQ